MRFDAVGDRSDSGSPPGDGSADATANGPDAPVDMGALVQGSTVVVNTGPTTVPIAPSRPGTLLVAAIVTNNGASLTVPTGWTVAASQPVIGSCTTFLAYQAANPGGVTSVTFGQLAGNPTVAQVTEWTSTAASPVDVTGMFSQNNSNLQDISTSAAAAAGTIAITSYCQDVNNPTYTTATGWTNLGVFSNVSSSPSFLSDYQAVQAAGVVTEGALSSIAGKYGAVIVTFKLN